MGNSLPIRNVIEPRMPSASSANLGPTDSDNALAKPKTASTDGNYRISANRQGKDIAQTGKGNLTAQVLREGARLSFIPTCKLQRQGIHEPIVRKVPTIQPVVD